MLTNLTERLIKDEVKEYNKNLLVEGVMLGSNMSTVSRYSFADLNECSEADLEQLRSKLVDVKFTDTMSVAERQQSLLDKVKQTAMSESSEPDTNTLLKNLRKEYIEACKSKDNDKKSELISQIKQLERIQNK